MTEGRFDGKVALITGAAGGLGRACATRLAEEGADIVALDLPGGRTEAELDETARLVRATGRRIVTGTADVRDFDAVVAAVRAGVSELGPLDVVVDERRPEEAATAVDDAMPDRVRGDETVHLPGFVPGDEVKLEACGARIDHQDVDGRGFS